MEGKFTVHNGTTTVNYKISEAKSKAVVEKIIKWCIEHGCWGGEMLHQDDDCQIEAPSLVSDIIDDILEFETEHDDD